MGILESGVDYGAGGGSSPTNPTGTAYNIGYTLISGVFAVTGADGQPLSASNAVSLNMPSTTGGKGVDLELSSKSYSFEDASGTSDIAGEYFGTVTGVSWSNNRLFTLYAVNSDDTDSGVEFGLSPNPCLLKSPATANIGYHGNPMSTPSDNGMFFLTSTDVTSTHNDKPLVAVRHILMTKDASDDWTVDTLKSSSFLWGTYFEAVKGQMGADSGSFFDAGSDTPPSWASDPNYWYSIDREGYVDIHFTTQDAGNCTNGSGLSALNFTLPYKALADFTGNRDLPAGFVGTTVSGNLIAGIRLIEDQSLAAIRGLPTTTIKANDFASTGDEVQLHFRYKAF